ncbi:hypothetical protein ACFB49_46960 [Sphingomonas sp. DBB INV C78]|uniref:hypothetical protein n=1 Tax=Sphingomonas sp. DBB INV C78 TaxID=3349434 RepID=UPI0036D22CAD
MKLMLGLYLIVTGLLAAVAISVPSLVVLGLFLGIVPGLILAFAPSAFLYGLAFGVIRFVLGAFLSGFLLFICSASLTLALFWALPQPGLARARALLADAVLPDIQPPAPIALDGHIRVERRFENRCDNLCVALLTTPGVTGVTIVIKGQKKDSIRTWRLVPVAAPGEAVIPNGFGFDDPSAEKVPGDWSAGPRALEAAWNLRLAAGVKLVSDDDAPPPAFVIETSERPVHDGRPGPWSLSPRAGRIETGQLRDNRGNVLLRRQVASIAAPAAPLISTYTGGIESGRMEWSTRTLAHPARYAQLEFEKQVVTHTNIARGVDREAAMAKARAELVRALDDPSRAADDAAFRLANQWLASFERAKAMTASDAVIVERVVADRRIRSADGLWAALRAMGDDGSRVRRLVEARIMDREGARENKQWGRALRELPAGAFAIETPEEATILADPDVSRYATAIIARQADRGPEALPDLLRLLEEHATVDPGKYGYGDASEAINAVRRALRALGASARPALPQVESLFARHERLQRLRGEDWDVTLVAMGMPLERVVKPANRSGTSAQYVERVARKAAQTFDPRRD